MRTIQKTDVQSTTQDRECNKDSRCTTPLTHDVLIVELNVHNVRAWHVGSHLQRAGAVQVVKETTGNQVAFRVRARDDQLT